MIYCAIDEAFNNSFKDKILEYDKKNVDTYKESLQNNNITLEPFDNYSDIDINKNNTPYSNIMKKNKPDEMSYPDMYPAFFTAQGDYAPGNSKFGTSIQDLKETFNDDDSFSISDVIDSTYSDDSYPKEKKKIDHAYYIDKFIKDISDDTELQSNGSCDNNDVYNHIKICKYCKLKINERLKKIASTNQIKISKDESKQIQNSNSTKISEHFSSTDSTQFKFTEIFGYDLKELIIIILAGIILIFVLDLLVKIGKKLDK